jgi:hypothetical protein
MPQSERERIERKVRTYPVLFVFIGVAIGMVLMVILFLYFEDGIRSWAGYSRLAFFPLGVYVAIALLLRSSFQRTLSQLLGLWTATHREAEGSHKEALT